MRNGKLFDLFKTFQKEEWKRCRMYLISQMNEEAELIYLYDYIMNFRKDLNHKKLDQDYAKDFLFKNKSRKNFLNLMSKLRGYVLEYFGVSHMRQDERELKLHTLQSLNKRGLHTEVNKAKVEYRAMMDQAPLDIWNSTYLLRLEHAIKFSDNPAKLNDPKGLLDAIYLNWKKVSSELSHFYLLDAINNERVSQLDFDDGIYLLKIVASSHTITTPVLKIVKSILSLFDEGHEVAYQFLYRELNEMKLMLGDRIGTLTLLYLIQYQLREIKSKRGSLSDLSELFDIGLRCGWLFDNGKISDVRFSMMIHTACLNGQFEKASELIKNWSHTLKKETRADIIVLSQANIKFYKSSYAESIDLLKAHSFKNYQDRSAARILLLMNYYLYYPENLDFVNSQIVNYKSFLKRHEMKSSKSHFQGALNFVEVLSMLVRREDLSKVERTVEALSPLVRRTWLVRYIKKAMNK